MNINGIDIPESHLRDSGGSIAVSPAFLKALVDQKETVMEPIFQVSSTKYYAVAGTVRPLEELILKHQLQLDNRGVPLANCGLFRWLKDV